LKKEKNKNVPYFSERGSEITAARVTVDDTALIPC
jgi:hypothetical protein